MLIIKDISNLNLYLDAYEAKGYSLGYIPTMGALHQGHGELIKRSKSDNEKTIISIFVNEKQFNSSEDFENYPRNRGKDYDFCDELNVDIIFEPSSAEIYQDNENKLENIYFKNILCDELRPGHFDGVITVLNKLFSIVKCNKVYFGEKDFQQLKIVEKFIQENYSHLELFSVPTFRTDEGIAFSSRNQKLSKKQLNEFELFHNATLKFMSSLSKDIEIDLANSKAKEFIKSLDLEKFDYFEFRNFSNLGLKGSISEARLFYAIYKGKTRLIDNLNF
tara:strand:+ start:18332 stop:19162 length:831 start_codon:yes stop_codon:yes gene_type:complete